ncbi:nickel pincer cofactor biosynthesis protein LarB [Candidatus Borrarchaeum sp.]|uniref:nickel pincer cofactor biosynthesis protein LarB n=1 Tax=Candidatus Borrarchaeum sp. TaxID=2846742 RepID=UPI00257D791E|nr:nickel pincer cofactor biosynthesis protein LarB [Candidatus Borrarchaeum sp.]
MQLKEILEKIACKELSIEEAEKLLQLKGDLISTAIEEVNDIAKLDLYRQARTGIPEVILAEEKRPEDAALLAVKMASKSGYTILSRISDKVIDEVKTILPDSLELEINERARMLILKKKGYEYKKVPGKIGIFAAGTSDIPVAEESRIIAEAMGVSTYTAYDVGIAGLHRLLPHLKTMLDEDVDALVVVAGMEGALPSVVAGLVDIPVVGVPSPVGYGLGGKGLAALNSMLQSCAPGVMVVNIDNGIGAGTAAALIALKVAKAREKFNQGI